MTSHTAKLSTVFVIVFIDLIGFGIVIPILPIYAEAFGPSAVELGLLMASFSAMQFIFAPILGRLSDRVGRRPVLLVSMVGSAVGYVMFGFAGSMAMLFASRIIDGISGGNISTAHAVIADITSPEDRAKGMGLLGAAFGLGFILGPAISGLLLQFGTWLPGVAAAVASMIAFTMVLFFLPETLDPSAKREARRHPLNLASLRDAVSHPFIGACLVIVFLIIFGFANFETTFAQYATAERGFTLKTVPWLFVYAGVLGALVQGGLIRRLAPLFGEVKLVIGGNVLSFVALLAIPLFPGRPALYTLLAVLALGQGLASPALSALVSKLVNPDEVGGVMGVYQGMSSLARVVAPFVAQLAYDRAGAWPLWIGAAAMLIAGVVGLAGLPRGRPVAAAASDG
jgi:DHA1 family tetracycline resistance protein-like MFS transporter